MPAEQTLKSQTITPSKSSLNKHNGNSNIRKNTPPNSKNPSKANITNIKHSNSPKCADGIRRFNDQGEETSSLGSSAASVNKRSFFLSYIFK